jgi:hypothetical protein
MKPFVEVWTMLDIDKAGDGGTCTESRAGDIWSIINVSGCWGSGFGGAENNSRLLNSVGGLIMFEVV